MPHITHNLLLCHLAGAMLIVVPCIVCAAETAERVVVPIPTNSENYVKALKSLNSPPALAKAPYSQPICDGQFDWNEQKRVGLAIQALIDHSAESWGDIVDHLDDSDYCMTALVPTQWANFTVGDVCERVAIDSLVTSYYRHLPSNLQHPKNGFPSTIPIGLNRAKFKAWCVTQKGTPLYELQAARCEKAKAEIESYHRQYTEVAAALTSQISALRDTEKAVAADHLGVGRFPILPCISSNDLERRP